MTRAKDTRVWARLTVDFADSPKIVSLSDAAFRALVEMILWSRRMNTDGVLPARLVETHWVTESVTQSVTQTETQSVTDPVAELLSNDPDCPSLRRDERGNYVIHDFLEHQESAADVKARLARNRTNGQRGGRPSKTQSVTQSVTESVTESVAQSGTPVGTPVGTPNRKQRQRQRVTSNEVTHTGNEVAGPTRPAGRATYPDDFETFWAAYPKRKDKKAALKAWKKAIKEVDSSVLIEGARRYAEDPARVPQYTKHPATWLNAGAWDNEPAEVDDRQPTEPVSIWDYLPHVGGGAAV